ncbi:sigma-70 family RNA polymerase sigma factor [Paenarthrobacter sp. JL.01a]|uniref:sigma-70 family RNA polymerase sigma factor n=1 Tax=Paenarthrobacter sp. JL.01a TaxID=2979324 RepID=UPI0021C57987|nr:sigma-70 family RNA polymerase sigma factor [Paenarthrobacter sp. JL.01a]UXM92010.1 sigma-70 family RNA polymerase sigma factor [Paenarthrobacter sp. JL.01a]
MDQLLVAGAGGASPKSAAGSESDPHLLNLVRQGVTEAFDTLYLRHAQIAQYVARAQSDNPSDADDVVAEAFASIFQSLKDGKGPREFFRSYLLTVVRRTAHERNRKARLTQTAADDAVLDAVVHDDDHVVGDLESSIMAQAFKSLPERWQAVLFHLDIEGLKPAAVAPLVGLTPNGVSSLAIRAREGLRQAYLQHHISRSVDEACDEFASQLGKYVRDALKRTSREKVDAHLAGCAKCTALLMELNDVQGGMRAVLFPLVAGVVFTPAAAASAGWSGAGAAAGATAASGKAAAVGFHGISQAWKITAALVVGSGTLAGVLTLLPQPNNGSSVAVAEAPASVPPVKTPAPLPVPSITLEPVPSVAAVPPPAPESQPPAVVIPPEEPLRRSAVVVDPGVVSSTTAPQTGAAAAPLTRTVEATFSAGKGSEPLERELQIQFSLDGDGSLTSGEAVFTLPDGVTFVGGQTVAPEGWDCSASAQQLRCASDALDPNQLTFVLTVTLPDNAGSGTLDYQFGGQGIVPKSFISTFH